MKKLILIAFLILPTTIINAQSANDYFHTAANFYINGEKANAKKAIDEAIRMFPNDEKNKQLANAINKLPNDPPKNNQNKKDNQKQDPPKDQPQQQQPQQKQMSKENAQQILDALLQDEKNAQDKAKKQPVRGTKKAEKDW
ncbi:MAG: hypothetical protein PHT07_23755 [Paludibacter sp.]|nr:hypothetical protein [Paludibacter sp.]